MKDKEISEAYIQHRIVMLLQSNGIFCHSVPNEAGGRSLQAQTQLVSMGLRSGVGDLVVWWPTGIGYLEVKNRKGEQSPAQVAFEKKCKERGIRYDLVRSESDVLDILKEIHEAMEG